MACFSAFPDESMAEKAFFLCAIRISWAYASSGAPGGKLPESKTVSPEKTVSVNLPMKFCQVDFVIVNPGSRKWVSVFFTGSMMVMLLRV